MPPLYANCIHL